MKFRKPSPSARHLVISGTGRAGTSFLVEFLAACGLPTGSEDASWHERARAGLEHALDSNAALPYVVKDPWLSVYCHDLDLDRIAIDGLIVPVRDLEHAAASRVLQERASIAESDWAGRTGLDVFGRTAGGVVYSLSVADQMRILAVGFHQLLQWAVSNEIPIFLLDFPRIVEDADYLVSRLEPLLADRVDRAAALAAHSKTARVDAIRVGSGPGHPSAPPGSSRLDGALDRAALVLRIRELEEQVAAARGEGRAA